MNIKVRSLVLGTVPAVILICLIEGAAQIVWYRMKSQALQSVERQGQSMLRNDAINYLKVPHPILGYKLAPNLDIAEVHAATTRQGFFQRESVAVERTPDSLRVMVLGDSAVMGHDVDRGSFPTDLRRILGSRAARYSGGTEVINAGVAGYLSDQTALWADAELADYRPDVVILYVGFNDFQSYPPCDPPSESSYFERFYGKSGQFAFLSGLKSFVLARALLAKAAGERSNASETPASQASHAWLFRGWQGELGTVLQPGSGSSQEKPTVLSIPTAAYAWTSTPNAKDSPAGHYVASLMIKGQGSLTVRVNGFAPPWPLYKECSVELTDQGRLVECGFSKPQDRMGVQVALINKSAAPVSVSVWDVNGHKPGEAAKVVDGCSDPYPPKDVYAFFLRSLDRITESFRRKNAATRMLISTLVGRWPMDTEEEFEKSDGHVWWMTSSRNARQDAAASLDRFNALIRDYAAANRLGLVDMAAVFAGLDRQRLMWSFAHMTNEGYEIMASTFYDALLREHLVRGVNPNNN